MIICDWLIGTFITMMVITPGGRRLCFPTICFVCLSICIFFFIKNQTENIWESFGSTSGYKMLGLFVVVVVVVVVVLIWGWGGGGYVYVSKLWKTYARVLIKLSKVKIFQGCSRSSSSYMVFLYIVSRSSSSARRRFALSECFLFPSGSPRNLTVKHFWLDPISFLPNVPLVTHFSVVPHPNSSLMKSVLIIKRQLLSRTWY